MASSGELFFPLSTLAPTDPPFSALVWYDFGLTLTTEVQRVWNREFSCVSAAYICMRYSVLVDRTTLVLEILLQDADNEASPTAPAWLPVYGGH